MFLTVLHSLRGKEDDEHFCMGSTKKLFHLTFYKCISESAVLKVYINTNTENTYKFQREEEGKMMNILVSGKNAFLDNYLVLQKYISAVLKVYDNTDIIVYRKSI